MKRMIKKVLKPVVRHAERTFNIQVTRIPPKLSLYREQRPTTLSNVEVLQDPQFRDAVAAALPYTILDTPRLANLWQLAREAEPGAMLELGVFRGGSSMLLSRAAPERRLIAADTFESFGDIPIDDQQDKAFFKDQFVQTNFENVASRLKSFCNDCHILKGYFPASDVDHIVKDIAFAHIDFDLYESTIQSLSYLVSRCTPNAVFVLDDFRRSAGGVDRAVAEFIQTNRQWRSFPMYPGQGILFRSGTA